MKIGQLGQATGTKVETIRYCEQIGLLGAPARNASNYRDYGKAHLARLSFVRRARDLGFTLDQVRELMGLSDDRTQSCTAVDAIATTHLTEVDRKIADLQALRGELSRLIGDCRQGTVADCLIIDSLAPAGLAQ